MIGDYATLAINGLDIVDGGEIIDGSTYQSLVVGVRNYFLGSSMIELVDLTISTNRTVNLMGTVSVPLEGYLHLKPGSELLLCMFHKPNSTSLHTLTGLSYPWFMLILNPRLYQQEVLYFGLFYSLRGLTSF